MKPFRKRYSDVILNLLVAVAISAVVNFSYLLLLIVEQKGEMPHPSRERVVTRAEEGVLSVTPNGHGYLVYENGDSVYIAQSRVRRMELADGDRLVVDIECERRGSLRPGAYPVMCHLKMHNGEEYDYSQLFGRPPAEGEALLQLLFYWFMAFAMVTILTATRHNYSARRFVRASMICIAIAIALYFLSPPSEWRTGRMHGGMLPDYTLLLRCSFVLVVSVLYGRIYVLISQRQAVVVENERLQNENLTTRYNMLAGQINPHFLFNSLNSLAMLVREQEQEKALTYIDQLSYTFRYIIQSGQATQVTLADELKFTEAYIYLFKIRYADKLFFDIEIGDDYRTWILPVMSLQPLVDNAVKHNTITRTRPFHVSIRTEDGWLVISNPRIPKLEAEPSTGIGLDNLCNRWKLITGRDVEIIATDETFTVRMPLQKPVVR